MSATDASWENAPTVRVEILVNEPPWWLDRETIYTVLPDLEAVDDGIEYLGKLTIGPISKIPDTDRQAKEERNDP